MPNSISNAVFFIVGGLITSLLFVFLGASTPAPKGIQYDVDYDTIDFTSKQMTIEITDHEDQRSYLYVVPNPTKSVHRGDSPIVMYPPKLVATIDLKTVGDVELGAKIETGLLPVRPTGQIKPQLPKNMNRQSIDNLPAEASNDR